MSRPTEQIVLQALIDGIVTDLMVRTTSGQVYLEDGTTLSSKLADIIAAINLRAKIEDVNAQITALSEDISSGQTTLEQNIGSQLETLSATVDDNKATLEQDIINRINALRQELLGDVPVEAYNTFTELAAYISEHEDISTALAAAIGLKADTTVVEALKTSLTAAIGLKADTTVVEALKTSLTAAVDAKAAQTVVDDILTTIATLGKLATLSIVTEDYLSNELKEKVNTAADANHGHTNKEVLDTVTAEKVESWDSKSKLYVGDSQPEGLTTNDLWFNTSR